MGALWYFTPTHCPGQRDEFNGGTGFLPVPVVAPQLSAATGLQPSEEVGFVSDDEIGLVVLQEGGEVDGGETLVTKYPYDRTTSRQTLSKIRAKEGRNLPMLRKVFVNIMGLYSEVSGDEEQCPLRLHYDREKEAEESLTSASYDFPYESACVMRLYECASLNRLEAHASGRCP